MDWEIFSSWTKWKDRNCLSKIDYPGVYCIAISDQDLTGISFEWILDIKYVGMTNSKNGLKNRLYQFDRTIKGYSGHGGAKRVRYKHRVYGSLTSKLFVSVAPFDCNVNSLTPNDLRIMGEVAKLEFTCKATFMEKYGHLPEFNDHNRSPKS